MKTEPRRLLESNDLVPEARALLDSLSPSPGMPADLKLALADRVTAPPPTPGPGELALAKWGAASVLGLLAGVAAWQSLPDTRPTSPAPLPEHIAIATPKPTRATRLTAPRAQDSLQQDDVRRSAPFQPARAPASAPDAATLTAELRLLGRAKAALPSDPETALSQLALHTERFPDGQLVDMREYLRLRAVALRAPEQLEGLGVRFLARFPDSPFVSNVQALLAGTR